MPIILRLNGDHIFPSIQNIWSKSQGPSSILIIRERGERRQIQDFEFDFVLIRISGFDVDGQGSIRSYKLIRKRIHCGSPVGITDFELQSRGSSRNPASPITI